jgi:ATP-dependent Clp protease ATP-binding subunit ClpA
VTVNEDGSDLALEAVEDGPVTPKPEPTPGVKKKRASRPRKPRTAASRKPPEKPRGDGGKRGLVPKVPLKTN